jgi:hypothetical protein
VCLLKSETKLSKITVRSGTRQNPTFVINLTKVGSTLSPEERQLHAWSWPAHRGTHKIYKSGNSSIRICKISTSCAPELVEDAEQDQRESAPDKYDFFLAIVSGDPAVVLDVWIAIEKLVSSAPDEDSGKQKDDHSESESNAQRRNAGLCDHRYHQGIVDFHAKTVLVRSIGASTHR